ncbi:MAG: cobyrinate a,c-diamide synthase [Betaproteobacteria bacterium]|nr:cobyrinate a,c-diamide synthase [Betaproteobacteria bacterium]
MPGILLSAAWKSSGKTTISIGLIASLAARGIAVQPFKKGPDYIDPMWLGVAAGRACRNLDPRLQGAGLEGYFARHAAGAGFAFVEGSLGLHDGFSADGSDSNATVARRLGLPVIVVLDSRGLTRGIAAILKGLQVFDPAVTIAGVILNRLASPRHEGKLRDAIERHTDIPVLGALAEQPALSLVERHLGLMPSNEAADPARTAQRLAEAIGRAVDVGAIESIARRARMPAKVPGSRKVSRQADGPRVAIARDRAFGFYYPDDLDALEEAGARLVEIDMVRDRGLGGADALFLGGGFPEMMGRALEANTAMREAVRSAAERGMPIYAECGGLMYLARTLSHDGETCAMAGVLPVDVAMHAKPIGKGYVTLEETDHHPWPRGGGEILAHEFHYSSVENADPSLRFAYRVKRGHGVCGGWDGIVHRNVLASYAHLRSVGGEDWARRFVAFARSVAAPAARPGRVA